MWKPFDTNNVSFYGVLYKTFTFIWRYIYQIKINMQRLKKTKTLVEFSINHGIFHLHEESLLPDCVICLLQ